jgi:hypothetical protein
LAPKPSRFTYPVLPRSVCACSGPSRRGSTGRA